MSVTGSGRAVGYTVAGDPEVLHPVEVPTHAPGRGEVQIEVARSGVNPTDVKARRSLRLPIPDDRVQVPHHDAAGRVRAVGPDVDAFTPGQRVWTHLAAYGRLEGTAQQFLTLPADRVAPLADTASFDLGAALGVPFLTAHRVLTLGADGPDELAPGALAGRTVLVAGGAGAVGNAAIQLAVWAGATVVTTVSSPEKAGLAAAAGAHHVVDYRREDVVARLRAIAPEGVDRVVEVAPAVNAGIDLAVLATGGVLAVYANDGGAALDLPIQDAMWLNLHIGFVILYTLTAGQRAAAARAVNHAVEARAVGIGPEHGLPVHVHPLEHAAAAHTAVEHAVVGKQLLAVAEL